MIINETDIDNVKNCSGALWNTFKDICKTAGEIENKEKIIDLAFQKFRETVANYQHTSVYGYAVRYAQDLTTEIERMLYPGKPKPEITRNTLRMNYSDFVEYIKDPEPGDMVTVLNEQGGNLARIKVRTVIQT